MTETDITTRITGALRKTLKRFVGKLNETEPYAATGTEAPLNDAQVRQILMRDRYEAESI